MNAYNKFKSYLRGLKKRLIAEAADEYEHEISKRNLASFFSLCILGILISIAATLVGFIFRGFAAFSYEYPMILLYFLVLLLIEQFYLKNHMQYITQAFYLAITPLMFFAILLGTYWDPNEHSVTIMIFICVLTLFFIDKPWRIILYLTVTASLYVVCCFDAKELDLFVEDLTDLLTFYLISVGVNFYTVTGRIDSVENYVKAKTKAEVDQMTGIYRRETGLNKVRKQLKKQVYGSFIIIDIDNLKEINDKYGHFAGDKAIREVSEAMRKVFTSNNTVLRMGGDEFIAYAPDLLDESQCKSRFNRLLFAIHRLNSRDDRSFTLSVSIGCYIYNKGHLDFDQIYQYSDANLYTAKKAGRGKYVIG